MRTLIKLFILNTIVSLIFPSGLCSEITVLLKKETNFSPEQISRITELVESAIKEGLPEEFIYQRVKEGISKKVEYIILYTTLIEKITKLKIAKLLLDQFYNDIPKKELNFCIQYLSEQLDQGLEKSEFVFFAKHSEKIKISPKELLKYTSLIIYAKQSEIELSKSKEVILNGITEKKSIKEIKTILRNIKSQQLREEILKEDLEKKHIER